jgi:hypothetical protein
MEVGMLGWKPAQATVVAKRFIQESIGAFTEYIVDVLPAEGGPPFRTTLRQMAYVVGEPDVGDVVPAFCKIGKQIAKLDWAKLEADALASRNAEPDGWDAARRQAPGTPVGTAPQTAGAAPQTAGTAPQTKGVGGPRRSAAELLASGQRMTAVVREFSPSGKTVGDLDPTLPDPGDPVYLVKVQLPIAGSSPIESVFMNRVPVAKVTTLRLGAQLNVAVNPANPSHEVAIDWANSPLAD